MIVFKSGKPNYKTCDIGGGQREERLLFDLWIVKIYECILAKTQKKYNYPPPNENISYWEWDSFIKFYIIYI